MNEKDSSSRVSAVHSQDRLKAIFLAVVLLILYVVTRTRHFGGDDTVYALVVQRFLEVGSVERAFLHPHHLIYNPVVALCAWLVRAVSGSVFVLDVGATVSAASGAAAVAGFYLVLRRFHLDDNLALSASAVLALSGGMWRYATRMEVYTLAAVGVVVWLATMSDQRASWQRLAAGFAAPWFGHSVLGLLVPPGAWLQRRRPRVVACALAAGVVVPGVVVVVILAWLNNARSASSVIATLVRPGSGSWLSYPDPVGALHALGGLLVLRTYRSLPVFSQGTMTLFDVLGVLVAIGLAVMVAWGVVASVRGRLPLGVTAALGVATLIPLWLVWDVGNHEHAVAASPLLAALAAVGAATIGRRTGTALLAAAAVALLIVNGVGSILLQTQPHLSRSLLVSDLVRTTVSEDATLVSVGVDPELRLALPHLGGRRVVDLTALVHSARRAGATPQEALDRWLQRASSARDPWLLEDPDSPTVLAWMSELGISDSMWREARARLRLGRSVTLEADGVVIHEPVTLRRLEASPR